MLAVASRSIEAAILRNPHNPVDCQSLPALSDIVSESSATSGSPSSWTPPEEPLTRLVDNALNGCSAPLLSEVTPSFDDLPEIPDEDTLDQRVLEPINDARPPSIQSSTLSTEQASKPTARIVSEKPMRNARGLVKQYRSYKRKAQPCAMGRTSLPTVLEDQDWESSAALPGFVRVYKRKKGKKAKRSKRVLQDGTENDENVQPAEGAQLLTGKDIQSFIPFI
ncbi:hypothetical protein PYCCODRAFT_1471525 [Trametes coccinea BRFM310]|uniref:Uncharacterized protein n=1 Tax=Trametes coccinea (strain BRFM310) TaxID=1353009 RepID=A0A1Y2IDB7_TRAC3|nr:hypothetical protein PYCCODRAFT_1471525 [Trametes coccinea BRFM310]